MRTWAYHSATLLAILLTLLLAFWGTASLWGAAAQPKIGEKYMTTTANVLLQDGHVDVKAVASASERNGLSPLPDNGSLAAWLAGDLSAASIRRFRETAIVCYVGAALSGLTTARIWIQRPRAT